MQLISQLISFSSWTISYDDEGSAAVSGWRWRSRSSDAMGKKGELPLGNHKIFCDLHMIVDPSSHPTIINPSKTITKEIASLADPWYMREGGDSAKRKCELLPTVDPSPRSAHPPTDLLHCSAQINTNVNTIRGEDRITRSIVFVLVDGRWMGSSCR